MSSSWRAEERFWLHLRRFVGFRSSGRENREGVYKLNRIENLPEKEQRIEWQQQQEQLQQRICRPISSTTSSTENSWAVDVDVEATSAEVTSVEATSEGAIFLVGFEYE